MFNESQTSKQILAAEVFMSEMVNLYNIEKSALMKSRGTLWNIIHTSDDKVALILDSKFCSSLKIDASLTSILEIFN